MRATVSRRAMRLAKSPRALNATVPRRALAVRHSNLSPSADDDQVIENNARFGDRRQTFMVSAVQAKLFEHASTKHPKDPPEKCFEVRRGREWVLRVCLRVHDEAMPAAECSFERRVHLSCHTWRRSGWRFSTRRENSPRT